MISSRCACSEALLLEALDFRFLTEQMLIEKLMRGAGASARPQAAHSRKAAWWEAAGPSEQPQGRDRPPARWVFLKPCLHAAEGLGESYNSLEQLRRFFLIEHVGPFKDLAAFFLYASSSVRSPAKISVLFLES